MSLSQKIIDTIERRRDKQRRNQPGAVGDFWREGGNQLLYELPVTTGGLIIDAGGYQGEWSAGMVSRYGCKSLLFEPVPEFFNHCQNFFKNNALVQVRKAALGGSNRRTRFNLLDNGTSEYRGDGNAQYIDVEVFDVAQLFTELAGVRVECFKLNIEGGEYEVLERLIETNNIVQCDSFLIQFHRQPANYESRYKNIVNELQKTHTINWCYEMVWEKWERK